MEQIIREVISERLSGLIAESGQAVPTKIEDDLVLLESGLDSMGFAILITVLEDEFGYDPFVLIEEPVYPRTFSEFVEVYERFADRRRAR